MSSEISDSDVIRMTNDLAAAEKAVSAAKERARISWREYCRVVYSWKNARDKDKDKDKDKDVFFEEYSSTVAATEADQNALRECKNTVLVIKKTLAAASSATKNS